MIHCREGSRAGARSSRQRRCASKKLCTLDPKPQTENPKRRCEKELGEEQRKKLGLFCQTSSDSIVSVHNVSEIYKVPLLLKAQNVAEIIATKLKMSVTE